MDEKNKIGFTVGFFILIAIGLYAVLDPTATEGYTAIGARSGLKQLIADYWGRNLGIGMMVLGALALVGLHQSE